MARKRKADPVKIELKQPDRSGPSDKTLLDIASERNLFRQADEKQRENDLKKHGWSAVAAADTTEEDEAESLSPQAERILDTLLWGVSLAMLHFTFDVLVQNQFAMEITWPKVFTRAFQALLGRSAAILVATISHAHEFSCADFCGTNSIWLPFLQPPPTCLEPNFSAIRPQAISKRNPTSRLLRRQHGRWLLSHPRHQRTCLSRRHEDGTFDRLCLGMGCARAQPFTIVAQSCHYICLFQVGRIQSRMIN